METVNFYLKNLIQSGPTDVLIWNPIVANLRTYMQQIMQKSPNQISSINVWVCPADNFPTLLDTDIVVYIVPDIKRSVIELNGGSAAIPRSNEMILGLTDLNLNVCEVYFDRAFQGSAKEIAGSAYHEAAHFKSDMDDSMHNGQDGLLTNSPDYNGSPTTRNTDFFVRHIPRKVQLQWRRIPG